jgi:hypothetical protein
LAQQRSGGSQRSVSGTSDSLSAVPLAASPAAQLPPPANRTARPAEPAFALPRRLQGRTAGQGKNATSRRRCPWFPARAAPRLPSPALPSRLWVQCRARHHQHRGTHSLSAMPLPSCGLVQNDGSQCELSTVNPAIDTQQQRAFQLFVYD